MTETEKRKIQLFMAGMAGIALLINCYFYRPNNVPPPYISPPPQRLSTDSGTATRTPVDEAVVARQAAQDAAAEHARELGRYVSAVQIRQPGVRLLAVTVVSEDGKFNRAVGSAVSARFKADKVKPSSSLFTSEFVSDGLFRDAFSDPNKVVQRLELANSADVLLFARQQVQYSQNPTLDNVITANMQFEVLLLSAANPEQSETWTLTANGAGFTEKDARSLAEERLIKQIAGDPKMSLSQIFKAN